MFTLIERNFIVIILALSALAIFEPASFIWVKSYIPFLLGLIMFCIGSTLNPEDFKSTWTARWRILTIACIKYISMSTIAFCIGEIVHLSIEDIIGLVIVGASPGGTAANLMSYLSRANVALTISLTFVTTLISPLLTPIITYIFLHKYVEVPLLDIAKTILLIVLTPLFFGFLLKKCAKKLNATLIKIFPTLSILSIALIIACVVALNQKSILLFPLATIIAVTLNNIIGYLLGYFLSGLFWVNKKDRRSIAFEFATQDTALGVMLAVNFFGSLTALAGAFYSVIQNITGFLLVKIWKPENLELSH